MSGFLQPQAGTDAVRQEDSPVSTRLFSSMQNVINNDAVYCALVQTQPEHAERRAMELVERLQDEDTGRQVAVLQSRIRKQELEGAQLRQEVASLQSRCRNAEESSDVAHAEGNSHAEQAKVHASEARTLRKELETVAQQVTELQSNAEVCDQRNALLTRQLAEVRTAEQTRTQEFSQQRKELEAAAAQMTEKIVALGSQLAEAVKERDELRSCTQDLRSTMAVQAKQLEQEMTRAVQERDDQINKASSAERRADYALAELEKTRQAEVKHRQELRRADGLLRSLHDERSELHYLLKTDSEQHQDMLEREAESRRRVEQESELAKALVEETMGKVELLQKEHKQAVESLQAQQACLDEESRTRTKLAKRLERVETARRQETKQLRDEIACLRQAAVEADAVHREAIQQRDVQLVVAESKAAAQRSQIEQQEHEVRRMQEQVATRERELATVHEERLNLELKQQQLRYDRRLQELDMENRGRSSHMLQDRQLELFRQVLQEENGSRTQRSVADEVGRLDNSLREAFSQQFSTVLKEITNRDDTARELEVKLETQRQSLRQEADAQLRKQAAESEAAAKASVEAVQAEATAAVTEIERKATLEREHLTQVRDRLISENEKLQERLDEQGADLYFIQQEQKEATKSDQRILELEAAKEELEASMSNLRSQLNVEQQAHTQTQQREADAQKHYQESIVQTQLSKHALEGLKAELQATRSAQHADCLQILKLQQQLTAREEQRSQLEEANTNLMEEIGQQQECIAELRTQVDAANSQTQELQERIQTIIAERINQHRSDMQQEVKEKLANVSSLVSEQISTFRNVMSMMHTDVRTEMQHVYRDQANTIQSTLERVTRTHARKESAQGVRDATMHGQEASCAAHEVREMRAAHNQICSALTQLAALDDKEEELVSKEPAADVNVSQAIQRLKTQKLDVWHEIQHLRKEVAVLVDERDDLLKRVDSADSVFHEQHQRFSEVLVLLSKTLAIPDQMLLLLSEPDVHEFTLGLNQVRAELEDWRDRATRATSEEHQSAGRIAPLLRENDALKGQLKQKEQQVEQIKAELQRRCTSFDCQLQSACSECTAVVEEHVTSSLASLKHRVDNVQKDIEAWKSDFSTQMQNAPQGAAKQRLEVPQRDSVQGMRHALDVAPHDDMEPSAIDVCEKPTQGSPLLGCLSDSLSRSLSVRHDDAAVVIP